MKYIAKLKKKYKNLVQIIKPFVPYIFFPGVFRQWINFVFFRKKTKHLIEYEKNFYKRHAFINKAISKFKNCKYLEIGVANNDVELHY